MIGPLDYATPDTHRRARQERWARRRRHFASAVRRGLVGLALGATGGTVVGAAVGVADCGLARAAAEVTWRLIVAVAIMATGVVGLIGAGERLRRVVPWRGLLPAALAGVVLTCPLSAIAAVCLWGPWW